MTAYKIFEVKLIMNISLNPNPMDFLLMPSPNMQMNTLFVMAGGRMFGGIVSHSNAMSFLVNRDSGDRTMDSDYDRPDWNANANGMNDLQRSVVATSTNDRVVFRTSGVNLSNGHVGAANEKKNATNQACQMHRIINSKFRTHRWHASRK